MSAFTSAIRGKAVIKEARAVVTLLGGRPGIMPQREWGRLFVIGTSPEDAAKVAETYRQNTQAADRTRGWR